MMTDRAGHCRAALGAATLIIGLAGCTAAPNPALDEARLGFRQAKSDPEVVAYAPVRLDEAASALQRAVAAHEAGESEDEVNHLAYVADQRVRLARARAVEKQAVRQIEVMGDERQGIQLEARTRDAERAEQRAREAEAAALALQDKLAELEARQTERGLVLTLGDILFDVDRAQLNPGGMQQVGRLAEFLREFEERNVLIEGHTDSTGGDGYNEQLSLDRARAVEDALIRQGIDPRRIIARGYGERYPVASNADSGGRQQNRRVEIVILVEGRSDAPRA